MIVGGEFYFGRRVLFWEESVMDVVVNYMSLHESFKYLAKILVAEPIKRDQ
tara:strand:+ start:274 stop:426 length:153 start_codon:yes stop_codon:yes gene_type:complete